MRNAFTRAAVLSTCLLVQCLGCNPPKQAEPERTKQCAELEHVARLLVLYVDQNNRLPTDIKQFAVNSGAIRTADDYEFRASPVPDEPDRAASILLIRSKPDERGAQCSLYADAHIEWVTANQENRK